MKNFNLKSLILLLGVSVSGLVWAGSEEMFYGANQGLMVTGTSGTVTYSLASKTNTVASSVIDLRTYGGMYVQVTGTTGMTGAAVQFSNLSWSASSFATAVIIPVGGVQPVAKKGSWARIVSTGSQPSGVITCFYEPVALGLPAPSYAGSVGLSNTVVPQWTILSIASYTLSATVQINLTATAGSSGIMKYKLTSLGGGAGFYHCTTPNGTWVTPAAYYAVSTTPIIDDNLAPGTCLMLSATAAACTVQVEISKLSAVAP